MLLIPFVENAFKHGANISRSKSKNKRKKIQFQVFNSKLSSDEPIHKITNMGLKNVQRGLALLYPHHHLEIANNCNDFKINLILNLVGVSKSMLKFL